MQQDDPGGLGPLCIPPGPRALAAEGGAPANGGDGWVRLVGARVCVQGARAALDRYPGSIGQDLALLRSGTLGKGSAEELAVKVRRLVSAYCREGGCACGHALPCLVQATRPGRAS